MLDAFLKFIDRNRLINRNDRILLAVSGGIDSMVMTDLFIKAGLKIGIAHCNFSLRGQESDLDEEFVGNFAGEHKIPFYSKKFETGRFSVEKGISVQMAARELRYTWFEEIRRKHRFTSVAVAHNLNDNTETFLINLIRGTGIAGLSGMRRSGNRIIRPLLFATRPEIENYCSLHGIAYREDRTNADTKYKRNKIRHKVIPMLKEFNPSIEITLNETADRLNGISEVFTAFCRDVRRKIFRKKRDLISVNFNLLASFTGNSAVLFELFRPYGISPGNMTSLYNIIQGETGSHLITETHRIYKNRNEILITEGASPEPGTFTANDPEELSNFPVFSSVRVIRLTDEFKIPAERFGAAFDLDKIRFPLTIRKWKHGDSFKPFGMTGRKKLSDYFTDRKYSIHDKESALVLVSAAGILWILGERTDNRFRITPSTKRALIIRIQKRTRPKERTS